MANRGHLIIFSAASGAGKSTILEALQKRIPNMVYSISTTTRPPRGSEKDGVEYHFVDKDTFVDQIAEGKFVEWALVHDNYYGTSKEDIDALLAEGKTVLMDIDVQGKVQIDKVYPDAHGIFIEAPSWEELEKRLRSRGTDSEMAIQKRLQNALKEMEWMPKFDFILINEELEKSKEYILAIAQAARLRRDSEEIGVFIEQWRKTD